MFAARAWHLDGGVGQSGEIAEGVIINEAALHNESRGFVILPITCSSLRERELHDAFPQSSPNTLFFDRYCGQSDNHARRQHGSSGGQAPPTVPGPIDLPP